MNGGDRIARAADLYRTLGDDAGRVAEARELLAEPARLRRELGFLPGVAANLVGRPPRGGVG
ncbi:hypothetical protein [Actinophytocola sp.]|uniref:hypothetical protein n=1 Tax=Actinophytocola sp. TaxID=1872138 RepID=UPI003D6B43C2